MVKMRYEEKYNPDGSFDLEGMIKNDNIHHFFELIVVVLFTLFFLFGGFNVWLLGGAIRRWVQENVAEAANMQEIIGQLIDVFYEYDWQAVIILVSVYLISLEVSYLIVKWFGQLAGVIMYSTAVIQIVLFGALFYYLRDLFEYNWIFLIPVGIQLIILIFWHKKFKLAIKCVKLSSHLVYKKRKLMVPQITQTLWIIGLGIFHIVTTLAVLKDGVWGTEWEELLSFSFNIGSYTATVDKYWLYGIFSFIYVLLIFLVMFVTLGIKMSMVHQYIRTKGAEMSFWHGFKLVRRRWWGLLGYSFASGLIHSYQFIYKVIKGEIKATNIMEAAKITYELTPSSPMAFEKKGKGKNALGKKRKKPPLRERVWMGLNYFTLPSIMFEDRIFSSACLRSLYLITKTIPDLMIKHSSVNKLFKTMQYAMVVVNGLLGFLIGGLIGYLMEVGKVNNYIIAIAFCGFFIWVGGATSALVLNDLNMTYITLIYMYTVDELNDKKGFIEFNLKEYKKIEKDLKKSKEKDDTKMRKRWIKRHQSEIEEFKEQGVNVDETGDIVREGQTVFQEEKEYVEVEEVTEMSKAVKGNVKESSDKDKDDLEKAMGL